MHHLSSKKDVNDEIREILRTTPNERWVELFKQRSDAFNELGRQIRQKLKRNDRNVVVHNLTLFNSVQCEQLAEAMNRYVDEIAWRVRNLFELNLVLRHVLKSEQNLQTYISLGMQEELEFAKVALGDNNDVSNPHVVNVQNRIVALETALRERKVFRRIRRLTIKKLAEEGEVKEEYGQVFDFISRYVHPSTWFVLGEPKETFSSIYRGILIYKGLVYSLDSYKKIDEYSYSEYMGSKRVQQTTNTTTK